MKKTPIPVDDLSESIPSSDNSERTLAEACLDYTGIEQYGKQQAFTNDMPTPYQQRLRSGDSLLMVVTEVDAGDGGESTTVRGRINYEPLPYENPDTVLASLRHKSQSESSTGEMVYGVKVAFEGSNATVSFDYGDRSGSNPTLRSVKSCPRFTITDLETSETTGTVVLDEIAGSYSGNSEYIHAVGWEGEADEYLEAGDYVLLEESPDSYVAESVHQVLQHPQYNGTHRFFSSLLDGQEDNKTTAFNSEGVDHLVNWMSRHPEMNAPNTDQEGFITDIEHELSMLQGPPGTGKTSTTLAPAILSRLLGYDDEGGCRTLVSGASNKAINEVMEDVAEMVGAYQKSPETSGQLDDVLLLRMTDRPTDADIPPAVADQVTFATPWSDNWPGDDLTDRLEKNTATGQDTGDVIVFATPRRVWHIGKQLHESYIFQSHVDPESAGVESNPSTETLRSYEYFDLMVIDEASMMDLPQFLLSGMFYDTGGGILLSGDHRQLSPVQQHDWESELAPSIRALAPHLSVLNFGRLMGGEQLQSLDDTVQGLLEITSVNTQSIPLHQLQQTYRCHADVASFLEKWVYQNLDDIRFQSERTRTLPYSVSGTEGVTTAANLDSPFVLVTYDDESFQQMNPLESTLTTEILAAVDLPPTNGGGSENHTQAQSEPFGVVTPHNAQRGHLSSTLTDVEGTDYTKVTDVDTVERFQGGEREMMIINATVSDPDYVATESDFLLDLNRLNVAMSRMKQKLVIIASDAIFDHIPTDVDEYDKSLLWKGLGKEAGLTSMSSTPEWRGTLQQFVGENHSTLPATVNPDTEISVHQMGNK